MSGGNLSAANDLLEKLEVSRWAEFSLWLVFFAIGVPGNLLILCVYRARRVRVNSHVHIFIGALAVADLVTCVLRFVDAVAIASVSRYLDYQRESIVYFLSVGLLYTTALLTTTIAFDRFDAVCRPLRRTMTSRRAKVGVAACYALGFAGITPEVIQEIYLQPRRWHDVKSIKAVVKFIPVVLYILSLASVTVFYSGILVFMRKRRRILARNASTRQQRSVSTVGSNVGHETRPQRVPKAGSNPAGIASTVGSISRVLPTASQRAPEASLRADGTASSLHRHGDRCAGRQHQTNAQSSTTKMLFIATFVFFILWFPNVYLRIYALGSLFDDATKSPTHTNWVVALTVLRNTVYLNSVVNAFIYGMANEHLRGEYKWVIIRRLRVRFGVNNAVGQMPQSRSTRQKVNTEQPN